jgi:hypothetical protein
MGSAFAALLPQDFWQGVVAPFRPTQRFKCNAFPKLRSLDTLGEKPEIELALG